MAAIDEEVEGTSICVSALMRDRPVSRAESVDDAWRNGADDEADAMVRNQPPEKKNEKKNENDFRRISFKIRSVKIYFI